MNNEESKLGLYEHNKISYEKIKQAFLKEDVVGIVHATGTGKTYNALQLAYDNKDKKIIFVVPSTGIIEHIEKIIANNPLLDRESDFPNLEFRTYTSFVPLSRDEIKNIDCDLLIIDEFHHIGAPIWGAQVNALINSHPKMKIFGMTAYTVRGRGTAYEKDMASPYSNELFSNKIVSRYDLCDAMIDGVLPKPIYKSGYINLLDMAQKLEDKVQKLNATTNEYREYTEILTSIKKRLHTSLNIPSILKKYIKPNGKYIYFCPPASTDGTNDIETIKKQAMSWFKNISSEDDIVFYTSICSMGSDATLNREAFYNDVTLDNKDAKNKLRIMFAVNQYNEGVHAPNIDGVIMGRGTSSDIVYFEQLGRALAVRGNSKEMYDELAKLSREELLKMCASRDIPIKEGLSKEEIIEKLIAPIVLDLANNFNFIKELENNLQSKIRAIYSKSNGGKTNIKISDASFDISMEDEDLYEALCSLKKYLIKEWDDYYELAQKYYEVHHDLSIHQHFKTFNGYDYSENGLGLGRWISYQRIYYDKLSDDQKKKLASIAFSTSPLDDKWQTRYELAQKYYEKYQNLFIPAKFKTKNGYDYDENGYALGQWISRLRKTYDKMPEAKQERLQKIGFVPNLLADKWQKMYELTKDYYQKNGPNSIKTETKTPSGEPIGTWLSTQRQNYAKLSEYRKKQLAKIGFAQNLFDEKWQKMYELALVYYQHYHNLLIGDRFKTKNGFEKDDNGYTLGQWIGRNRKNYHKLSEEQKDKLTKIGMVWNIRENTDEIEKICEQNGIDSKKNMVVLKHISYQALGAKINFLKSSNLPITNQDGLLDSIFSMSSGTMQEKYGISLEELLKEYDLDRKKERF